MPFATGQRSNTVTSALIAACRAELVEAFDRWTALNPTVIHDARLMGPHPSEQHRLPHEHAAATLLNVWGHLHPIEVRAIECATRLVAQRKAGWTDRAARTLGDLRRYLLARSELRRIFDAAAADYWAARAAVDMPIAA